MLDKSTVAEPSMLALNILSFCMDVVAVLLALTFTHGWGLRAPAGPTLFPMWVGTGFLAPIAVAWPIIVLAVMLGLGSGQRASSAPALLEPWVPKMVYTLFVGQWLTLMTAFILYARARWPLWVPLSLAWTGSGAMFSWGSWLLLAVVSPFSRGFTSWLLTANNVIKIGAGLLIGALIGSLVAAQARSGFSEVARPQDSHVMQFMPGDDVSDGAHA